MSYQYFEIDASHPVEVPPASWTFAKVQNTFQYLAPATGSPLASVHSAGVTVALGFLEKTATNTFSITTITTLGKALLDDATVVAMEATLAGTIEALDETATGGACGVTQRISTVTSTVAGNYTLTLAGGSEGQTKEIFYIGTATDVTFTVTPAASWTWTSYKLDANGRSLMLKFIGGKWAQVGGNAEAQ